MSDFQKTMDAIASKVFVGQYTVTVDQTVMSILKQENISFLEVPDMLGKLSVEQIEDYLFDDEEESSTSVIYAEAAELMASEFFQQHQEYFSKDEYSYKEVPLPSEELDGSIQGYLKTLSIEELKDIVVFNQQLADEARKELSSRGVEIGAKKKKTVDDFIDELLNER